MLFKWESGLIQQDTNIYFTSELQKETLAIILVIFHKLTCCFYSQGELVYANFGEEGDFLEMERQHVNCSGHIIIMRLGRIPSGQKVCRFKVS